jgi:hypothetical protein
MGNQHDVLCDDPWLVVYFGLVFGSGMMEINRLSLAGWFGVGFWASPVQGPTSSGTTDCKPYLLHRSVSFIEPLVAVVVAAIVLSEPLSCLTLRRNNYPGRVWLVNRRLITTFSGFRTVQANWLCLTTYHRDQASADFLGFDITARQLKTS